MGMGLRFPDQILNSCFFVTTTFREWRRYGEITGVYEVQTQALTRCLENYEALLPAYVFMPSHLHLILVIEGKHLPSFMRDFKKYLSQKAFPDLGITEKQIWKARYDRVAITSEKVFLQKLHYIHENPVRAELVREATRWRWSSARDYYTDDEGAVPVWKGWR